MFNVWQVDNDIVLFHRKVNFHIYIYKYIYNGCRCVYIIFGYSQCMQNDDDTKYRHACVCLCEITELEVEILSEMLSSRGKTLCTYSNWRIMSRLSMLIIISIHFRWHSEHTLCDQLNTFEKRTINLVNSHTDNGNFLLFSLKCLFNSTWESVDLIKHQLQITTTC